MTMQPPTLWAHHVLLILVFHAFELPELSSLPINTSSTYPASNTANICNNNSSAEPFYISFNTDLKLNACSETFVFSSLPDPSFTLLKEKCDSLGLTNVRDPYRTCSFEQVIEDVCRDGTQFQMSCKECDILRKLLGTLKNSVNSSVKGDRDSTHSTAQCWLVCKSHDVLTHNSSVSQLCTIPMTAVDFFSTKQQLKGKVQLSQVKISNNTVESTGSISMGNESDTNTNPSKEGIPHQDFQDSRYGHDANTTSSTATFLDSVLSGSTVQQQSDTINISRIETANTTNMMMTPSSFGKANLTTGSSFNQKPSVTPTVLSVDKIESRSSSVPETRTIVNNLQEPYNETSSTASILDFGSVKPVDSLGVEMPLSSDSKKEELDTYNENDFVEPESSINKVDTSNTKTGQVSSGTYLYQDSDESDDGYFGYLISFIGLVGICFLLFHNKKRLIALVVEGRRPTNRRRSGDRTTSYRKLENNFD